MTNIDEYIKRIKGEDDGVLTEDEATLYNILNDRETTLTRMCAFMKVYDKMKEKANEPTR